MVGNPQTRGEEVIKRGVGKMDKDGIYKELEYWYFQAPKNHPNREEEIKFWEGELNEG